MSERDFTTISPSAKAILLVRSQTTLPYARAAAELLFGQEEVERTAREVASDEGARRRVAHFDDRARSIDDALSASGARSALEIGGGLAFRGLAAVERADVDYIDSDLPEIVAIKESLTTRLSSKPRAGVLRFAELDALDRDALLARVAILRAGEIAIVNEGLLMYFDDDEKRRLVENVRAALLLRGGVWITADIYVRTEQTIFRDAASKAFVERHGIDEKKFVSFDRAEAFFVENGFSIERRAPSDETARTRQTWTLRAR